MRIGFNSSNYWLHQDSLSNEMKQNNNKDFFPPPLVWGSQSCFSLILIYLLLKEMLKFHSKDWSTGAIHRRIPPLFCKCSLKGGLYINLKTPQISALNSYFWNYVSWELALSAFLLRVACKMRKLISIYVTCSWSQKTITLHTDWKQREELSIISCPCNTV